MAYLLITLAAVATGFIALTAPARERRWAEVAAGAALLAAGYALAVLIAAGVKVPNPTDAFIWLSGAILRVLSGGR